MVFSYKNLIGLKVITQDGRHLGQVKDFEVDVTDGKIIKYIVLPSQLVQKILATDLIISQSQVIEVNNQEMIVDSGLIGSKKIAGEFAA